MIKTIKDSASVPDPGLDRQRRETPHESPERRSPAPAAEGYGEPDLRLVIEPDETGQDYVYKLINRTTGEEVSRMTRVQVAQMGKTAAYTAGAVVRTKA
jgi:hypothetical protein